MKVLEKISDFAGKWTAIIALAVAIIAFVAPAPVHAALPTSWVNPLLGIVMFGMGMTLKIGDFKVVFTKPKAVITGILSQFIIMPLIVWVLCLVFQLPIELAVGVMLVGCCPGGTSSNVMTYLSKGDVALSVGMTACTTIMVPKNGGQYAMGKRDLFGVVISLRYLLPPDQFLPFRRQLARLVDGFARDCAAIEADELLDLMGFPKNWADLTRYGL